jgi:hypothetical protein
MQKHSKGQQLRILHTSPCDIELAIFCDSLFKGHAQPPKQQRQL